MTVTRLNQKSVYFLSRLLKDDNFRSLYTQYIEYKKVSGYVGYKWLQKGIDSTLLSKWYDQVNLKSLVMIKNMLISDKFSLLEENELTVLLEIINLAKKLGVVS